MSTEIPEVLASNGDGDLDIPAKKLKIDHSSDASCSEDAADTEGGKEVKTPSPNPRELQNVNTFDVVQDNVEENVAQNFQQNSGEESDSSDTEDDFQLPALKMPQVFDFSSLSYEDRREGIMKILHSGKSRSCNEIQQIFTSFVAEETSELLGYQAVWRSADLACDVLVQMDDIDLESFPLMMMVEIAEPFCCLPGSTGSPATEEQVISYLKDNDYKVDVVELLPVHDDSGEKDQAALVMEHTRFFFKYIWRLSDVSNFMYAADKFINRHLDPRMKLYFDVLEKNVSPGLGLKYESTITEYQTKYRQLRKKQDYIEKYDEFDYTDTDTESDIDRDRDTSSDKDTGDNNKGKDGCDSEEDGVKCHLDKFNGDDSDIENSQARAQDIPMDRGTNIVNVDLDSDKDENVDENKDSDIQDSDTKVQDQDIAMDLGNEVTNGDTHKDSDHDKCGSRQKNSDRDGDKIGDTNQGDNFSTTNDNEESGIVDKRFPELEVFEISRLWKDLELLEDTLEMMENPVMRHLMEIPRRGVGLKKNSAVAAQQTRRHNEPVTHIVAEKVTLKMIQTLRLPAETVLETHSSPASAVACCYDNDTIFILPGTYSGDGLTEITHSVKIRGVGRPEDIVIISKGRDPEEDLFVGCYGDRLTLSNLTFIDESDSVHFRGLLEVDGGSTRLTNCRFVCGSTGVVVTNGKLDIQGCEISGAQAPGIHAFQCSLLNLQSCYIYDCGKTDEAALVEDMCGVRIDSPQQLERKVPKGQTSVRISNCKIQRNTGPAVLLKIYSTDKQEEAEATDLSELCTLTCRDLQVTDNDFSGNGKGVAMVTYCRLK